MTLDCPHCRRSLEYSGDRPRFCAYCGGPVSGASLTETVDEGSGDATMAYGPATRSAPRAEARDRVGNYRLIRQLGRGGMGTVHEAEDLEAGRRVAVKLLSPGVVATPEAVERFRREGRLASAIAHPRCVFVLAADEDRGDPFIAMELMTGENLQDLVAREGPLAVVVAVAKILDVVEGLAEAHRLGVIHRDVKPSNCFLEADGRVKVGDFGLSKSMGVDAGLTRTGAFLGTPLYASPEQIKAEELDAQTDVYSVAATLYFLLTGRAPHEGRDAASTLAKIVSETPPTVRSLRPEVPRELEAAVMKGLERSRDRRWRDLHDLREGLLPFAAGRTTIGGFGLRIGAYIFDIEGNKFVAIFLANFITLVQSGRNLGTATSMLMSTVFDIVFFVVNFAVVETWLGCSPGKKLLRLRVFDAERGGRPPTGRALRRAGVFFALVILPPAICRHLPAAHRAGYWSVPPAVKLLGLLAIASTMRAGNGYRGLHERLSGTKVIRLPRPSVRRRRAKLGLASASELSRPEGLPSRLGPFEVRGAIRWADGMGRLLGVDESLGREVWIDVGPPGGAAIPDARRGLTRGTRPRWVGGGALGDRRWEAYLRPEGLPLGVEARLSAAPWREVRPGFEQLAEELAAAAVEGTLPRRLDPANVLVQPGVGIILDDGPEGIDPVGEPIQAASARALRFLGAAGALAIEGTKRGEADRGRPVRGPIPLHARAILDRLLGGGPPYPTFGAALAELKASRDRPTELGGSTRFILGLNATIGLAFRLVPPFALVLLLRLVVSRLTGRPLVGPGDDGGAAFNIENPTIFGSIAACWFSWAAATRGGLVPRLLGLALVDRDGLTPSRRRCVGRELLIWGPQCALLALSNIHKYLGPGYRWLEMPMVLSGVAWTLFDAAFEAWRPGRQWHDWASGTRLVPR